MSFEISELLGAHQMRVLLKIVDCGSFSAAALAMGISQPAISQHVKRLERAIGSAIFKRRNVGVELTNVGEAIAHYARTMMALEGNLRAQLVQSARCEKVSLGVSDLFCRTKLSRALEAFHREHPDVEVGVISGDGRALAGAYANNLIDFAIVPRTEADTSERVLCAEAMTWRMRDGFTSSRDDPVPLCLPMSPALGRDMAIEALKVAGRVWRVVFESNDASAIAAAVRAGIGIGVRLEAAGRSGCTDPAELSGLPSLPPLEFVMRGPSPNAQSRTLAFAEICRATAQGRAPAAS